MSLNWEGLNWLENIIWEWRSSVKSKDELFIYLLKFCLSTRCSFFSLLFSQRFHAPFFVRAISLYSPLFLYPILPLVDLVGDLLDACPIQNFLEVLCIAVNWDITVQVSFPHKCDQLVGYRTFNVVVAAFFSNISSFIVGFFPQSLSSKEWLLLAQYSLGVRVPTFHNAFQRKLGSSRGTISSVSSFRVLGLLTLNAHQSFWPSLGSYLSLGIAQGPTFLLGSFILTITPQNSTFFLSWRKWGFDFCFQTSHAQWTFPRDNISSPALNTLLTLQHPWCPINCFIWRFVPHVQRCNENPTVEIFYGNSREKFLAPCAFLSKENGGSIYSIS